MKSLLMGLAASSLLEDDIVMMAVAFHQGGRVYAVVSDWLGRSRSLDVRICIYVAIT